MLKIISKVILITLFINQAYAAKVDTVEVYSSLMKKEVKTVVISPKKSNKKSPVVYLLHGYGGDAKSWLAIQKDLPKIVDLYQVILVCPDGKKSWYWDSPQDSTYRYESFITKELVTYIDSNYPSLTDRSKRAITGLSMGGHGAMWLALRNTSLFGAVGSTSGGLDIRPFPEKWDMKKQLGDKAEFPERWENHTVINQLNNIKNGDLAMIFDCGYDDFFFQVNENFHKELLKRGIMHDYLVRPGRHDGNYWSNSIQYQLLFFNNFFNRK